MCAVAVVVVAALVGDDDGEVVLAGVAEYAVAELAVAGERLGHWGVLEQDSSRRIGSQEGANAESCLGWGCCWKILPIDLQ